MTPARLILALAPLTVLGLSACQQEAQAPVDQNPSAKPGLSASDGILVLPAVKGNPAAAYLSLTNRGDTPAALAGVSIDAAETAEIHESKDGKMASVDQVDVAPGATVKFDRGGLHVMAFGLNPDIAPGSTVEITLTFTDGDKLSVPLKVEAVGGATAHDGADH